MTDALLPPKTFNRGVYYHASDGKVNMVVEDQALDRHVRGAGRPKWRALAHGTAVGDARITDLARPLPMSFAGVSRHVGVLRRPG